MHHRLSACAHHEPHAREWGHRRTHRKQTRAHPPIRAHHDLQTLHPASGRVRASDSNASHANPISPRPANTPAAWVIAVHLGKVARGWCLRFCGVTEARARVTDATPPPSPLTHSPRRGIEPHRGVVASPLRFPRAAEAVEGGCADNPPEFSAESTETQSDPSQPSETHRNHRRRGQRTFPARDSLHTPRARSFILRPAASRLSFLILNAESSSR